MTPAAAASGPPASIGARWIPWYDLAESMLRVEQIGEGDVPRSGQVFAQLMARLGYSCDRARYAVRNCLGSGFCVTGCIYGAKQSLHVNYLPQAIAAGATVTCDAEVLEVCGHPDGPRGQARRWPRLPRPLPDRQARRARWSSIAPAWSCSVAGTVGTARLLLQSVEGIAGPERPRRAEHRLQRQRQGGRASSPTTCPTETCTPAARIPA